MNVFFTRAVTAVKPVLPVAARTCWWLVRLMVVVSLLVEILRYTGVIAWMSGVLSPFFELMGLPGEASLAFISGYFVNVYAAIAVMSGLDLSARSVTILAVMVLCAHNMIVESAVQKKCGTPMLRIFIIRTLSAVILGFTLNALLPEGGQVLAAVKKTAPVDPGIWYLFCNWLTSIIWLILKMVALIFGLSVFQRLLSEFGVIRWLSRLFRHLLKVFGLPARTSFLWIVANVLGLAYGAAVMIEETETGKISRDDADLLNHHIAVSHSNLEDVLLLYAAGGAFWWMLLSRWLMAIVLVWERRVEKLLNHLKII